MNSLFILSLIFFSHLSNPVSALPKRCSFEHSSVTTELDTIVCKRLKDVTFDFLIAKQNTTESKKLLNVYNLYFHLSRPTLIESASLRFEDLNNALKNNTHIMIVIFSNIKGFEINQVESTLASAVVNVNDTFGNVHNELHFVNSNLEFYSGHKLISNCEEYRREHKNGQISFLQAAKNGIFRLFGMRYKTPICTLSFNNTSFRELAFYDLIDTLMKTNVMRFVEDENEKHVYIDSFVRELVLNVEKVDLDRRMLNENIFKWTRFVTISGELRSIQSDLFINENFKSLIEIIISAAYMRSLSSKQGIEWIRNINKNVSFDLNALNELNYTNSKTRIGFKFIKLHQRLGYNFYKLNSLQLSRIEEVFPDEDFCIYEKYPFNQMVILGFYYNDVFDDKLTCTYLWLSQYNKIINDKLYNNIYNETRQYFDLFYIYQRNNDSDLINDCEFQKRLSRCDKNQFFVNKTNKLSFSEVMFLWDFISIILLPLICIFGTVTNILVIVNVSKKENKTILKENQYDYMKLKSIANCGIFFVQILSLINICQGESGIYCPDIHRLVPIQFIKIIFVELFGNYFRFVSNLFYIAFLMNRISLIGKDHSKFTKFMSETKVLHFSIFTLIVGFIINFVKVFRYKANFYQYNLDYPTNFSFDQVSSNHTLIIIFLVFNSICDILNGSVFLIFCLIIDIFLALNLKRTIEEKEKKLKDIAILNDDKKNRENSDAINRAVLLVVLNSIINFTCKLPSTLISINEMVQSINSLIQDNFIDKFYELDKISVFEMNCLNSNLCQAFERFSIDLFLLSLAIDLFFYYYFDKKFKESFLKIFFFK